MRMAGICRSPRLQRPVGKPIGGIRRWHNIHRRIRSLARCPRSSQRQRLSQHGAVMHEAPPCPATRTSGSITAGRWPLGCASEHIKPLQLLRIFEDASLRLPGSPDVVQLSAPSEAASVHGLYQLQPPLPRAAGGLHGFNLYESRALLASRRLSRNLSLAAETGRNATLLPEAKISA